MTIINNVFLNNRSVDIEIEGGVFKRITPSNSQERPKYAIIPAFYNTHCHAAMTLLRGYADDFPLQVWLGDYIWPFEEKMTPEDFHRGAEIAAREMISNGVVFFNDMYFENDQTISVVEKSGMRACVGYTVMDPRPDGSVDCCKDFINKFKGKTSSRTQLAVAPHAIYTVCGETLQKAYKLSLELGVPYHIHVSETTDEVADCIRLHGMRPVEYLDSLGVLGPNTIAAHCVHVNESEWEILAKRGVTISHNPCSNMKLGSGRFPYELAIASGVRITLGTDGASSGNNLDLREAMKFAALFAKSVTSGGFNSTITGWQMLMNRGNASVLPAHKVFEWATKNGAEAFGINGGVIEEGKVADCILVDLESPKMSPLFEAPVAPGLTLQDRLISDIVYSADSSCFAKVMCDGKWLKG